MRFATLEIAGSDQACIRRSDRDWAPLNHVRPEFQGDLLVFLDSGTWLTDEFVGLQQVADDMPSHMVIREADARFQPPYRRPRKIWGIGLNYGKHAGDLSEQAPDQPASFIKADHTIIGAGEAIVLPTQSERTTAEAEVGLVVGRRTQGVDPTDAMAHVFGVCAVLDQTAEDILQLNPRYLTRSKNFPTFFSFGPEVVTLDEFLAEGPLEDIEVCTLLDGSEVRRDRVANMTHAPADLVSFHSQMMPLYPGDIISTGTPGAGVLTPGCVAEARIDGLMPLLNPVRAEQV
ncbi:fumarylacetoacetate hydrolase family protein [Janibacter cremeus]|uniref:2-keto-4-pentenoate hydratase/2-oxohepta-3-ene-1,7-dioic acid hydratase in catechol pathway n=1 Tax=Janibacter cremeus TaxID=1285192 RepID=A0A852VPQ3_9MICO|nr:fumarylacetoacetate hydrolase family protein [Janibacter cremeus]NYF97450.1 2-keto-4-pentenoate hydratase/2-oxohepta-3-ene-1,7-dioic acid hydratase in catechol pathway [Janibacter cremeus]